MAHKAHKAQTDNTVPAYVIHGDYYAPGADIDGTNPEILTHYAVAFAGTESEARELVADLTLTRPDVDWYYVAQADPQAKPQDNLVETDNNVLYVAGWNIPGYLPETEPEIFDNETDAIRYLSDTVSRFWDEDAEAETTWADRKWADVFSNLPYETAPFNITNNDHSLTFWVTVVPKSELPYNTEGN